MKPFDAKDRAKRIMAICLEYELDHEVYAAIEDLILEARKDAFKYAADHCESHEGYTGALEGLIHHFDSKAKECTK